MENMKPGGHQPSNDDSDKTIYQSQASAGSPGQSPRDTESDKTQIDSQRPTQQAQQSSSSTGSGAAAAAPKPADRPKPASSGGISTGAAIGVAGAAGVAGVAGGAYFGDEIKDGASYLKDRLTGGGEDDPQQEDPAGDTDGTQTAALDGETAANSISGNFTDAEGNVFKVELMDFDGDGAFEVQNLDIESLDGNTIHLTSNGNDLGGLLGGLLGVAGPEEYVTSGGYYIPAGHVADLPDFEQYHVQDNDTLSEIAQAHHTSIANIMRLNPQIEDPNVIHTGEHIILPTNDNIDNPYEGFGEYMAAHNPEIIFSSPENSAGCYTSFSNTLPEDGLSEGIIEVNPEGISPFDEEVPVELGAEEEMPVILDPEGFEEPLLTDAGSFDEVVEYEQVDWAVFEEPVPVTDGGEYEDILQQTDFNAYDAYNYDPGQSMADDGYGATDFL